MESCFFIIPQLAPKTFLAKLLLELKAEWQEIGLHTGPMQPIAISNNEEIDASCFRLDQLFATEVDIHFPIFNPNWNPVEVSFDDMTGFSVLTGITDLVIPSECTKYVNENWDSIVEKFLQIGVFLMVSYSGFEISGDEDSESTEFRNGVRTATIIAKHFDGLVIVGAEWPYKSVCYHWSELLRYFQEMSK